MSHPRRPLFVSQTPVPGLPVLTLYEDTWNNHIVARHPELADQAHAFESVVSNPTQVVISTNNRAYYTFVNETVRSTSRNKLLTVHVDPVAQVIASGYYNRSTQITVAGTVIWPLPQK